MRYKNLLLLIAIFSCVDPFSTNTERETTRVVVEGGITNMPPPYSVTLSTTANFNQELDGIPRMISGASVQVCDDDDNCIPFFEISRGEYSSAMNVTPGEIGKTYHVEIKLPDGTSIASQPETMKAPVPIERVYWEYDPATVVETGFTVYVDTQDPQGEKNYYKWETDNYYPYSERFCFTRFYERNVQFISSDKNVDGNLISRMPVKVVGYSSTSMFVSQVYQLAISARAYEFLENIKKQVNTSGSIFDPPPGFLRGNLFNVDSAGDEVLGYFLVASASRKDVVIDRSVPDSEPRPFVSLVKEPLYCGDPCDPLCVSFGGGTCGNRPCPPDCVDLPGITNIAPGAWPYPHQECGN